MERDSSVYEEWYQISEEMVATWLSPENLEQRNTRSFQGFEITDSLDGRTNPQVEISLVRLLKEGQYPQHVHYKSDAYFIVTDGNAVFMSGNDRIDMKKGDRVDVPRGKPHGFEIPAGETFQFISLQSPPIKDEETGEEDFHLTNHV
jgi:mannose-6-phosphate isomerase-like protein (cupin superfamily)